ncbi:MAG TPA: AAC(3) family N-acetyltransferase, partial [bacterium]|nr:AAC(3) family N-acetyltransferase [bacterium]
IGDSGTILMPAFTFSQNNFHFRATKVDAACGILPELLRRRAKSTRSNNHPLSFVATGKNAVFFINNAIKYETLDELSPIKRLIDKNGKLLMLGVEFNNCLPVIYADIIFSKNRQQSCGKKYYIVEDIAKNLQSYKELIIGEALCRVMNVGELVEAIIINLTQKPNLFNCYNNNCRKCMSHIKINRALFDNNKCKEL